MDNIYLSQLFAILLIGCGLIGLTLSGELYGRKLSHDQKRRMGVDWERKGTVYSLPIRLETIAGAGLVVGGFAILSYTGFNLCSFLAYWIPSLPRGILMSFSC